MCSLGGALFHAARASTVEDGLKCFDTIERRVNKIKTPNEAKILLIIYNLLITFHCFIMEHDKP